MSSMSYTDTLAPVPFLTPEVNYYQSFILAEDGTTFWSYYVSGNAYDMQLHRPLASGGVEFSTYGVGTGPGDQSLGQWRPGTNRFVTTGYNKIIVWEVPGYPASIAMAPIALKTNNVTIPSGYMSMGAIYHPESNTMYWWLGVGVMTPTQVSVRAATIAPDGSLPPLTDWPEIARGPFPDQVMNAGGGYAPQSIGGLKCYRISEWEVVTVVSFVPHVYIDLRDPINSLRVSSYDSISPDPNRPDFYEQETNEGDWNTTPLFVPYSGRTLLVSRAQRVYDSVGNYDPTAPRGLAKYEWSDAAGWWTESAYWPANPDGDNQNFRDYLLLPDGRVVVRLINGSRYGWLLDVFGTQEFIPIDVPYYDPYVSGHSWALHQSVGSSPYGWLFQYTNDAGQKVVRHYHAPLLAIEGWQTDSRRRFKARE